MSEFGVIDYTIFFSVLTLCFIIYYTLRRALNNDLERSVSSFFSLVICLVIFPLNKVIDVFIFTKNISFSYPSLLNKNPLFKILKVNDHYHLIFMLMFLTLFMISYVLFKLVILGTIFLILHKDIKVKKILSQKINIFLNAIKVTILIAYLFNAVAFSFSRTYSLGYTKGMVLLPIVNTKLDPYLKQASLINEENNKINAYVDLFTSVEIRNDMHELLEELNTYEELFISEIYPIISLSGEVNTIPKLYQETYGKEFLDHGEGVLALLLIDDQVLFDVVFRDIEDKDISLSKVPIYDNYKYTSYNKKLIELYKYVKNNQSLILWLSIEDDDNDLIQNFMENYKSIHKGTDKRHQKQLERLYLSSKQYYMMRNYVLDIMASESLLDEIEVNEYALSDEIIIEYLKDKDHFDTLIKKFNKDYKNKKFEIVDNRHRLQFKTAYQLSNDYLDEYRTYSLSLNEQVHPKTRLIASYVNSHQGSKDFFNHTLAFDILLDSSNKNNDNIYNLTDYVILHYLNEEHKIKVDENKLSQLLEKMDQLVRVDTSSGTQSLLYENRLGEKKSYIETYYTAGYITYEGMLTLNRYDEYFDSTEIQNLMK